MNKNHIIVTVMSLLPCFSMVVKAEPAYQSEVDVNYSSTEETGTDYKVHSAAAAYNYYLEPIEYGEYPYALATFFSRSPSIQLFYDAEHGKLDSQTNLNSHLYSIGYNSASNDTPLTYGLTLYQYTYKQNSDLFSTKQDTNIATLSAGYYLTKFSQISLIVSKMYSEFRSDFLNNNSTITAYALDYYHVLQLGNGQHLGIDAHVTRTDWDPNHSTNYAVQLSYFPTKSFGLGIEASNENGDLPDDNHSANITAQYYFTPYASATFQYEKYYASISDENSNSYNVSANFRF